MAASRSPIDTFAKGLSVSSKPGDAIHAALEGIDVDRLAAFTTALQESIVAKLIHSGPKASASAMLEKALERSSGTDSRANVEFARKIQAAIRAADFSDQGEQRQHEIAATVDHVVDHYISSQKAPQPEAGPGGQRRHFNKAQLTEVQHIAAGTATVAEIKDVQRELKVEGLDIGKSGKHHDGVDGDPGKSTKKAIDQAMKKMGPSSTA